MNKTTPELKSHLLLDQPVMSGPDGETWMNDADFELFGKPGKRRFLQVSDERLEGGREYIVSVRPNDRVMIGDGLGDEPEAMTPFADWILDGWPQIRAAKTKLWFRWVKEAVPDAAPEVAEAGGEAPPVLAPPVVTPAPPPPVEVSNGTTTAPVGTAPPTPTPPAEPAKEKPKMGLQEEIAKLLAEIGKIQAAASMPAELKEEVKSLRGLWDEAEALIARGKAKIDRLEAMVKKVKL